MTRYPDRSDGARLRDALRHLGCAVRHQGWVIRDIIRAGLTFFNLR